MHVRLRLGAQFAPVAGKATEFLEKQNYQFQDHHQQQQTNLPLFLFATGLLPTQHPAEDPVPSLHKEPTVQHTQNQSQSLPVLQAQKMHRRGNESRW